MAAFLLINDAGLRARGWSAYPAPVARRLAEQREAARTASTPEACEAVLEGFFRSIRKGHLGANPRKEVAAHSSQPSAKRKPDQQQKIELRRLSRRTVYVKVPSFGPGIRRQLEEAIARNTAGVRDAPALIIDVRGNGGGSDSGFRPLLGLLGQATYRTLGTEALVTEGTVAGWRAVLDHIPASEPDARRDVAQIVDRLAAALKDARQQGQRESWFPLGGRENVIEIGAGDSKGRAERVWVMIDGSCGSSCEQFVLNAKQNPRVTLVGRPTLGALDASNLRPVVTASGALEVWYATTYVRRPPGQEIDEVGIPPTVALPAPVNQAAHAREVATVRGMLE